METRDERPSKTSTVLTRGAGKPLIKEKSTKQYRQMRLWSMCGGVSVLIKRPKPMHPANDRHPPQKKKLVLPVPTVSRTTLKRIATGILKFAARAAATAFIRELLFSDHFGFDFRQVGDVLRRHRGHEEAQAESK